jgi:hypothetical protein
MSSYILRKHVDSEGSVGPVDLHKSGRISYITRQDEDCVDYPTGPSFKIGRTGFEWLDPPTIYLQADSVPASDLAHIKRPLKKAKVLRSFHPIIGNQHLGLYLRTKDERHEPWRAYTERAEFEITKARKVSTAIEDFKAAELVPGRLRDYMCFLTCLSKEQSTESAMKAPGVALSAKPHKFHPDLTKSLHVLDLSSRIYRHLPKATVSLSLISLPLYKSSWYTSLFGRWEDRKHLVSTWYNSNALLTPHRPPLPSRPEAFGCITLFDSGKVDLGPDELQHAFAVCSEDTIYVPAVVLSDPFLQIPEYEMRGIIGNFSRPGISILVSPFEPRIRGLSDSYDVVKHETYDLNREDDFKETTMHLSFTDWVVPLATENSRTIDHDAQVVEAVISIRDRGHWVADIDILEVDFQGMTRFKSLNCENENHSQHSDLDYTSIDSWEEMLDEPSTVGFFRAHGNWAARLAAVSILSRNGSGGQNFGVLGPEPLCLRCLEEEFEKPGWDMLEYESTLPSFCID